MNRNLLQRVSGFLGAGALGFVVDAGTFALALEVARLEPLPARLVAFLVAATTTWAINRHYAFADRRSSRRKGAELGRYVLASLFGGAINIATYTITISVVGPGRAGPYIALAAGVGTAMLVNFILYNAVVFRHREPR